ncbi:MAG: ATP synthase F1 subunit epsilon [Tenuifilaceae bacterium]|jgi:F-type H+-transporting ATPase subunit epsilon|nr:ATP synthase F1 subunit epsilon [Tenuifilaceae bacterium]
MLLEIITPQKLFFKDQVDVVRVPGSKGSFAMMHNHVPIISTLEPGIIKITQLGNERFFHLFEKGVVEQHNNKITILATKVEETYPLFVR